jgi:general secretion pathway protein D
MMNKKHTYYRLSILRAFLCISFIITSIDAKQRRNLLLTNTQAVAEKKNFQEVQSDIPEVDHTATDLSLTTTTTDSVSIPTPKSTTDVSLVFNQNGENDTNHYLEIIYPQLATDDQDDKIEVNLENADLLNVLDWISSIFKVTFLSDDILNPPGKYKVGGHAITFKTNAAFTKRKVWDLFLTWLDLMGLAAVPGIHLNFYKIVTSSDDKASLYANRSPLPAYINVDWHKLPNNDARIRYIYLLENTTIGTINPIIDKFRGNTGVLIPLEKQNGFILTDNASIIRSIMEIVSELDRVSMPEGISVIELKHADADDVKKMYETLTSAEQKGSVAERLFGAKKQSTELYFPSDIRLVVEPRTNALIILGTRDGIKKVEDFIKKHIDTSIDVPYSPLYIYELQYANAKDVAAILTHVTAYKKDSPAGKFGGVRDGDKFFKPMTFVAEDSGNRLLISADKEDYLNVREIIQQIDVKQPQIALEVLVVDITLNDTKSFGAQIRNKTNGSLVGSANFQNSGLPKGTVLQNIVADLTSGLLANLIPLAIGQAPGSTLVSVGNNNTNGVWAIFEMLQTFAHTTILARPFLLTTNNYPATIKIGETRRVTTATVQAASSATARGDYDANLQVDITPLINSTGIINLSISVSENSFTNPVDLTDATSKVQNVYTNANVANGEVLALGGLTKITETETEARVPILGSIPIVGWFFKNKIKQLTKSNLLIFISPRIVESRLQGGTGSYTKEKAVLAKGSLFETYPPSERKDPIHRWFFNDTPCDKTGEIDEFLDRGKSVPHTDITASSYYQNRTSQLDAHTQTTESCSDLPDSNVVNNTDRTQGYGARRKSSSITNFMKEENEDNQEGVR